MGGELRYLAGRRHRRMLSGCGNASISLIPFLPEVWERKYEEGEDGPALCGGSCVLLWQRLRLVPAWEPPLLDVAGGSRSRIQPSFNNSWILPPPSRSWLLAGNRLKAVFVTCPHLREHLECIWFMSETAEARLAAWSWGTGFPWLFQKLLRFLAVPVSLSTERLLWKTLHPLFLPFLPSRFLSALSMAYFQRVSPSSSHPDMPPVWEWGAGSRWLSLVRSAAEQSCSLAATINAQLSNRRIGCAGS